MAKHSWRLITALLTTVLVGVGGSAAYAALGDETPTTRMDGQPYLETSLFFGTARPHGGQPVTDKEFHAFVDEVVTPQFPAGLTVQEGYGQYRDAHGVIERERSFELTLLYPISEYQINDPKIERIRQEYNQRFGQESVARVDDHTTVDF